MTDTYVGWDGKSYPWPPPDGWYHASDGRWWAPGTGPNPPTDGPGGYATSSETSDTSQMATQAAHDPDPTTAYHPPLDGPPGVVEPGDDPARGGDPGPHYQPDHEPGIGAAAGYGAAPGYGAEPDRADGWSPGGDEWTPTPAPRGGDGGAGGRSGGRILMIGLGVVAALVVGGLAYAVLQPGGDDTDASATTADDSTSTDPGAGDGSVSSTTTPTSAGDGSTTSTLDDTTTSGDSTPTTNAFGATTTTLAPEEAAERIDRFRSILADADLSSDELSDTDLSTLGTTFCIFATASGDEDDFDDFRQQAVDSAETTIGGDQLEFVVDAAVVVFCPDEADRLGISL
ncbi:MAG: hypothetical protein ACFCVK_24665 [Acidimicrobiales bacterium]